MPLVARLESILDVPCGRLCGIWASDPAKQDGAHRLENDNHNVSKSCRSW